MPCDLRCYARYCTTLFDTQYSHTPCVRCDVQKKTLKKKLRDSIGGCRERNGAPVIPQPPHSPHSYRWSSSPFLSFVLLPWLSVVLCSRLSVLAPAHIFTASASIYGGTASFYHEIASIYGDEAASFGVCAATFGDTAAISGSSIDARGGGAGYERVWEMSVRVRSLPATAYAYALL